MIIRILLNSSTRYYVPHCILILVNSVIHLCGDQNEEFAHLVDTTTITTNNNNNATEP